MIPREIFHWGYNVQGYWSFPPTLQLTPHFHGAFWGAQFQQHRFPSMVEGFVNPVCSLTPQNMLLTLLTYRRVINRGLSLLIHSKFSLKEKHIPAHRMRHRMRLFLIDAFIKIQRFAWFTRWGCILLVSYYINYIIYHHLHPSPSPSVTAAVLFQVMGLQSDYRRLRSRLRKQMDFAARLRCFDRRSKAVALIFGRARCGRPSRNTAKW